MVNEESEKYGFSSKINDLLIKNVENFVFNNNGDDDLTSEKKEIIKQNIEEEIKKDVDLGKIYESNKEPIEHWIKENLSKAHDEMLEKFIMIPKINIEREKGEYFFEDFDLNLSVFNQKSTDNEIFIRNLIDASDQQI